MKIGAGLVGERLRALRIEVGNGEEPDGGMLRGKARPQRADAAGADHRNAELFPNPAHFQ